MPRFDAIILGAGASGLFCAQEAARRGLRVVLLERSAKPGRKILISGGGRANFTNLRVSHENFVSTNPHFCKSALTRFTPEHFIERIRAHGIRFTEKKHGQLFCEGTAAELLGMLLDDCRKFKVDIRTSQSIVEIEKADTFAVRTTDETFTAPQLVVATGGPSVPKCGASDFGYQIARQFGHALTPRDPALCGFVLSPSDRTFTDGLSGVSASVEIATMRRAFQEDLLFTHWGISGPAVLQASLYWNPRESVSIRFCPNLHFRDLLTQKKKQGENRTVRSIFSSHLPERLIDAFFRHFQLPNPDLQNLSDRQADELHRAFSEWKISPKDWIGWDRAEVTRGGISTASISSKTMESTLVPGLYWVGEVIDVTGQLGGFNFQWAWSSAFAAAQALETST